MKVPDRESASETICFAQVFSERRGAEQSAALSARIEKGFKLERKDAIIPLSISKMGQLNRTAELR
jgi:hypothetical protein